MGTASTSYMRPQNLGTARVVSRNKTISAFLAEGFWCRLILILAGAVFYVLLYFETLLVSKSSVP